MLKLKEDYMKSLPWEDLFRYLSNGQFITEIFMVESEFNKLFQETVLADFDNTVDFR